MDGKEKDREVMYRLPFCISGRAAIICATGVLC